MFCVLSASKTRDLLGRWSALASLFCLLHCLVLPWFAYSLPILFVYYAFSPWIHVLLGLISIFFTMLFIQWRGIKKGLQIVMILGVILLGWDTFLRIIELLGFYGVQTASWLFNQLIHSPLNRIQTSLIGAGIIFFAHVYRLGFQFPQRR